MQFFSFSAKYLVELNTFVLWIAWSYHRLIFFLGVFWLSPYALLIIIRQWLLFGVTNTPYIPDFLSFSGNHLFGLIGYAPHCSPSKQLKNWLPRLETRGFGSL